MYALGSSARFASALAYGIIFWRYITADILWQIYRGHAQKYHRTTIKKAPRTTKNGSHFISVTVHSSDIISTCRTLM